MTCFSCAAVLLLFAEIVVHIICCKDKRLCPCTEPGCVLKHTLEDLNTSNGDAADNKDSSGLGGSSAI